jgi:hypothetical protein
MDYKELEDKIYNYPTKYKEGFLYTEIQEVLKDYPNISMKHFDDGMLGNTCSAKMENNKLTPVIYHCDVLKSLIAGIEGRNLTVEEWD